MSTSQVSAKQPDRFGPKDAMTAGRGVVQVALELTQACNYRCIMCDYWKISDPIYLPVNMARDFLGLLSDGRPLSVLLTGGEPLLHPEWRSIAEAAAGAANVGLCTNGSPIIERYISDIGIFNRITVSIDGAQRETFRDIRGRDHLGRILRVVPKIKDANSDTSIYWKFTIQRQNFREIGDFFQLALDSGAVDGIAYGIPDFSASAFGFEQTDFEPSTYLETMVPTVNELDEFEVIIGDVKARYAQEIANGFIYEGDLDRYLQRFKSLRGLSAAPPGRRCSIPKHSMVLKANGELMGCYFLNSIGTFAELMAAGEALHQSAASGHDPLTNSVCQSCDQLMFANSPYEEGGAAEDAASTPQLT